MRPVSRRPPLDFELRCAQCQRVRDREFYAPDDGTTCAFCLRKAERIRLGLFTPGTSSRSSGLRAGHRRKKFEAAASTDALQSWRTARRAALESQGIVYGAAAAIMASEELQVRQDLGLGQ